MDLGEHWMDPIADAISLDRAAEQLERCQLRGAVAGLTRIALLPGGTGEAQTIAYTTLTALGINPYAMTPEPTA